ncbi:Imm15 family immunity protein [Mangrovibacter plantisponsor]|uniref:Immunity protein 15 of polymorphic toxin system n=1 Tax=Mangrovibacter plantisponsor TaxID=451513 RepID=A0A317PEP2_9ENTR|nr:Imm15 family immunity protein [Mangrovibacter plantisponsor]PWV98489.1 immunity protein 15 of polymorphic toxin system [Mangrovibacter plantisponsor]
MNKFDKKIQKLIKKEGLNDPDIFFADYETFEEIPLFSRSSDISFLSSLSFDDKNTILLQSAIELLTMQTNLVVNALGKDKADDFFSCVTITGWDSAEEMGYLKPNILLTQRKTWLLSNLNLKPSDCIEAKLVRKYLADISTPELRVLISDGFEKNKRLYIVKY